MQFAKKATLLAAVALISASMLIDTVTAVEVTETATPVLPTPDSPATTVGQTQPALTPPSPDCFILGSRSFTIPFTIDATGGQPAEVRLFVSRGPGDPWKLFDQKRPNVAIRQFQFIAAEDGEYWFATRTVDTEGRPHPVGEIKSQLKVYVDTTKPHVTLSADADATGRVDAVLMISDATPLKNVRLRYVTDNLNQWQNVDVRHLPRDGKLQFNPTDSWKQISLQFVATDTAGNQSVVTQSLRRPRLAAAMESRYAAAPANDSIEASSMPFRIRPSEQVDAYTVSNPVIQLDRHKRQRPPSLIAAKGYAPDSGRVQSAFDGFRGAALPARRQPVRRQPAPAKPAAPRLAPVPQTSPTGFAGLFQSSQVLPATRKAGRFGPPSIYGADVPPHTTFTQNVLPAPATAEQISNGFGLNSPTQALPETSPVEKSSQPLPSQARTAAEAMRPLSESSTALRPEREQIPTPKPEPDPNRDRYKSRAMPIGTGSAPIRFSDSERFSLAYELEAVGSQGVDAIELYGSVDGGKTWSLWGQDPDQSSPFDIETKEQGVFGFQIVVVGRNGLASPRPQAGETPDIVVVVDKESPTARIVGAQYGEGDRIGSLVIRFECEDANLMQRPIALSFSDSLEGPWTTIAAGLRNDGDYVWPADPQLPRQLFLRIDATDQAGNVGTHILDQPIDSQGLAPRARIRGFQSLSGGEPPPMGEQTAKRPVATFQ